MWLGPNSIWQGFAKLFQRLLTSFRWALCDIHSGVASSWSLCHKLCLIDGDIQGWISCKLFHLCRQRDSSALLRLQLCSPSPLQVWIMVLPSFYPFHNGACCAGNIASANLYAPPGGMPWCDSILGVSGVHFCYKTHWIGVGCSVHLYSIVSNQLHLSSSNCSQILDILTMERKRDAFKISLQSHSEGCLNEAFLGN